MAGEDYSIKTKVEADVTNFERGMNKAEKSLKSFSNNLADNINRLGKKGLVGSIANVTLAMQGLTKSFGTVIKFAKDVGKAVNECTEAYKAQAIAERALDTAISNNPFVSGASSKALKEFASEMQKVSNYGDEELIPMMTNLVSLGRTETETMQIMSVAMDMSAGMGISLDTAITQLNATLNGNIGRLGQQNAELKDLTAEELKQGKAIEILGEKFKGLSGATADTSKQLKNIKGDFKEALGQFTLPSSDMWNKFWAGFYENGIKIINRFNDYLDASIIGKNIYSQMTANADIVARAQGLSREEVLSDFRYLKEQLKTLNDEELKAYKNYLANLKTRTQGEERMLTITNQILQSRGLQEVQEKKIAEEKAKTAKIQEEEVSREKELADLREKTLKLEEEWNDKLFAQRLAILEDTRERELENEELTLKEKLNINEYYGKQILSMKLKQIEKEREKTLAEENLTEEARLSINLYYDNKITEAKQEESDKVIKLKKNETKEEKKELKKQKENVVNYGNEIYKVMKNVSKKIVDTFKTVIDTIGKYFKSGFSLFKKIVSINISDMLDNILEFEDLILTFFVEKLPMLPAFVGSVIQSIQVLLGTLKASIKRETIADVVYAMLKQLGDALPGIISDTLDLLEEIIDGAIDGLIKWLDEGGLVTILKVLLKIQDTIQRVITDNLEKIADLFANHIDDFAEFLANSMTSANKTLPKLTRSVLKLVTSLIEMVAKAFENDEFIDSLVQSIEDVITAVAELSPRLIASLVKLIVNIIVAILPRLPEIILTALQTGSEILPNLISELIPIFSEGIQKLFKGIFTADFWGDVLQGMAQAIANILTDIPKLIGSLFGGGSGGGGSSDREWYQKVFDPLDLFWHADGTNNAQRGLSIVGEAGPELVRFRGGEQVLNNRNTNKALAEMGGTTINQNVTFNNLQDTTAYAMMQQLRNYNRSLAFNGVL